MTEHDWAAENLGDHVTGILSADESARLARHLAECAACTRSLAQWRQLDDTLAHLFAGEGPGPALQDRLIGKLRTAPPPRPIGPWLRIAMGLAAVVLIAVVGAIGYGMHGLASQDRLALPGNDAFDRLFARRPEGKDNDAPPGQKPPRTPVYSRTEGRINSSGRVDAPELFVEGIQEAPVGKPGNSWNYSLAPNDGKAVGEDWINESQNRVQFAPVFVNPNMQWMAMNRNAYGNTLYNQSTGLPPGNYSYNQSTGLPPGNYSQASATANNRMVTLVLDNSGSMQNPELYNNVKGYNFNSNPATGNFANFANPRQLADISLGTGTMANINPAQPAPQLRIQWTEDNVKQPENTARNNSAGNPQGNDAPAQPAAPNPLAPAPAPGASEQPQPAKGPDDGRKIVRTGELEFEVASFDKAFASIVTLLADIKGGQIARKESTTGENRKTRGDVVVRMPPEHLDKFVADLRKALAELGGELKTERIRTVEQTKIYIDLDARLKRARAKEESYDKFIKETRPEVKDRILAQRELEAARTEAEVLLGEIQFLNNQVALSTLTISLTEKDLQTAAALVQNETVKMNLAVDNVDTARDATLTAVKDLQGRIIKSELKELPDGQRGSKITLEVPHERKEDMVKRLKALGDVTAEEVLATQKTEGGISPSPKLKLRYGDVQFSVELSNLAGSKSRETMHLKITSRNVAEDYKKLRDKVAELLGQVRHQQLKEQDPINISATIEFDLLAQHQAEMMKVLAGMGDTVSRSTTQVPPAEAATLRKVGFNLTIVHFAGETPREMAMVSIEVADVAATLSALRGMARDNKGVILTDKGPVLGDKGKATGVFQTVIPLSARSELVGRIKELGQLRNQQFSSNPQAPDSPLAVVNLTVNLASADPIIPSDDGIWPETRKSLYYAFKVLSMSLLFIIVGICGLLPWVVVIWVTVKVVRPVAWPVGGVKKTIGEVPRSPEASGKT